MDNYFLFAALALVAEVIGTVSGFGSSILFVPIASLFFDFKAVLAITAVFHVFSNLSKIALFRQGVDKNIALKLGIPAIVFVVIGAFLTNYIPQREIKIVMNLMLLALSVYLVFHFNKPLQQTDKNLYISGVLSGFLAGLVGSGGAIRGLCLAAFQLHKEAFIATSAIIDLGVDLSRSVVYIWSGYFLKQYLVFLPLLLVVSVLGTYIGKLILGKTQEQYFRYLVLVVIIATALVQLYGLF